MSTEWVRVGDTPRDDLGIGVPRRACHLAAEHVLEQDHVAEDPRVEDALGLDHVVHVAELRGHHQQPVVVLGPRDEPRGLGRGDRERLLAQHVDAAVEEEGGDLGVGARRRAHDDRVERVLVAQAPVCEPWGPSDEPS